MIGLVLEHTGEQALGGEPDRVPLDVQCLAHATGGAFDRDVDAREREETPGNERHPSSSISVSAEVSTMRGLHSAISPLSMSSTMMRFCTPTWVAASPTPGASYIA